MPSRVPIFQCLRAQTVSQCSNASRAFSSTPSLPASTVTQRRRHRDPYAIEQARARKAANRSRQEVLKKERAAGLGDPIRGVTTPFVQSFDTALPPEPSPPFTSTHARTATSSSSEALGPITDSDNHLNFFISKDELEAGVKRSEWLTKPITAAMEQEPDEDEHLEGHSTEKRLEQGQTGTSKKISESTQDIYSAFDGFSALGQVSDFTQIDSPEDRAKRLQEEQETAQEALRRISSLSLGSSKDRLRVNVQRCIDVFGRHNTDQSLPPKAPAMQVGSHEEKDPRVGPDTGSSEVQIAILTAKIRTLADSLALRGHPDKMNKRNLRLLVHRRAKLLKYLRKKERGGPRWQNLINTLGLTDGTWKGEISL